MLLHGATEKQKSLNTFYSGMGGYGGYGYRGWGGMGGMGTATTTVSEYLVGTLVVDIFDAKSKALIFRGTASDEISDKPEKNIKKVEKASAQDVQGLPSGIEGEEVGHGGTAAGRTGRTICRTAADARRCARAWPGHCWPPSAALRGCRPGCWRRR